MDSGYIYGAWPNYTPSPQDIGNSQIAWPAMPTCHVGARHADLAKTAWREGDGERRPFRNCYYCGSIHPEDLLTILKNGGRLHGADWKYGWPHKFYIDFPNPEPERIFHIGGSYTNGVETPNMGTVGSFHAKWYNEHFMDEGFSPDAFEMLTNEVKKNSGVEFYIREDKLYYKAPSAGYQA